MKKKLLPAKHLPNVKNVYSIEQEYIQEKLMKFILSEAKYSQLVWKSEPEPDHATRLRILLVEHICKHFTLKELYILFYRCQAYPYLGREEIRRSKEDATIAINIFGDLSEYEIKHLKKKLWDMNKIVFGLINELVNEADLFEETREEHYADDFYLYMKSKYRILIKDYKKRHLKTVSQCN
jgi:hypothetical protein